MEHLQKTARQIQAEQTKLQIFEAAMRLLEEQDFETITVRDIVKDLPPLYEAFYASEEKRTCKHCGALHPGKQPPEGWVSL